MNNNEQNIEKKSEVSAPVKSRKPRRRHLIRKIFKRMFVGLLAILAIAGLSAYFLVILPEYESLKVTAYDKLASVDVTDMTRLSDTQVFDTNGKLLGIVNAGHFEYVEINDISINLQNAYVAHEDKNFKIHHGVDWSAVLRAGIELVRNKGVITQGGSTITQQVVKNTYLTSERTFTRKFVEILLARELEKMYTKADIMEFYCNTNFYGNSCYGVEAASRYYFGKAAKDLNIVEAATLAGISNAPSIYEPIGHPEACLEKRNQVLKSMREQGYITADEYKAFVASDLDVTADKQKQTDEDYLTSYALHCAALTLMDINHFSFEYMWDSEEEQQEYEKKYGESYEYYTNLIRSGGYDIYTSLNPDIQGKVQTELDEKLSSFTELQNNGKYALQGAAAVVDNRTGYVVAVVGGRGTEDKFNRAYLSARQPGSAIKPLLDYAPALDSGEYSPATLIDDHMIENGPSNSGGSYRGVLTLREALNRSLNTVAWQILEDIGTKFGISYLSKMHFMQMSWIDGTTKAVSIGGFTYGVRIVDMAKGYSTLANMGQYNDNTCILKIVHEKEGDLTKDYKSTGTKVFREDTAWMMTDMLKGTIEQPFGTGYGLQLSNGQIAAGKTGTTNESKDTWFCGYTRYYTMAVWVGYDTPRAMPGVYGSTYAGRIWQNAMNVLHEGLEPADWTQPATVDLKVNENGITDYVSTTAEVRAQQALHEKEQLRIYEEAETLVENYERLVANTVSDVLTARKYYEEVKPLVDSLDDNEKRAELLKRLETRKPYFDEIEESWEQVIERALQQSEEESSREQQRAESEAESSRSEEEKRINKESFLSALTELEELEYRDENTEKLITETIMRLQYCNTYEEASMYAKELQNAIKRARKLPLYGEYAEEEESREESEKTRIKDLQESLEHLDETNATAYYVEPSASETFPDAPVPVFG